MSASPPTSSFYVGWDVGGWNCDKNDKSRDAIVILDAALQIVGKPWRGSLRNTINDATDTAVFLGALFALCGIGATSATERVTSAIDTPLGFPQAFANLITGHQAVERIDNSATNPYLFRRTERFLFEKGLAPLSAIKDMIGSQATKGMHTLARFAPHNESCGVWTDGQCLVAIEAYPSACKASLSMEKLRARFPALNHDDKQDALTCALVAYLYDRQREDLVSPEDVVAAGEGWIWVPKDSMDLSRVSEK
jgi:predicted nuclease with RNAse H fold